MPPSAPFRFREDHPREYAEWDLEKNTLSREEMTVASSKQVWWRCSEGHSWQAEFSYRIRGFGYCVVCVSIGTLYPELVEEWDHEKNDLTPWDVRVGSGKKVWWIGKECGHSWDMEARSRIRQGHNCPYCSGQRVLFGFNDFTTTHPELSLQWDHEKNTRKATETSYGSKRKVWWREESCGHSWELSPLNRTKLSDFSCPVCQTIGVKSPHLLDEWDDEKDPYDVMNGSRTKLQWKCRKGHRWKMSAESRALAGQGCPYCSGRRVAVGETDLLTTHPHLAAEWDDERDMTEFSRGSGYRAQWRCTENRDHTWKSSIHDRTTKRARCPHCARHISRAEQELIDYIRSLGYTAEPDRKMLKGKELDIYIPEKQIAIEYNGVYWHSEVHKKKHKWYHYEKWKRCRELGVQLITIWEDDYRCRPELVREMLAHKLSSSQQGRVYARNTVIAQVSAQDARDFYEKHHIHGYKIGKHIGLYERDTGEIVAVSTWKKHGGKKAVYLQRFATSCIVAGGFSKLLKYAVHAYLEEGVEEILTFADHTVSDGGLYEAHGFSVDTVLDPDYMYTIGNTRKSRLEYTLQRFREDPELTYESGCTEKQLAAMNRLFRIWDCGKTRYRMSLLS